MAITKMLLQLNFTEIFYQIYHFVEIIIPYFIPFMNFVQPFISGVGNRIRSWISPLYSAINLPPNYYSNPNYTIYLIIGGVIFIAAVVMTLKWPNRPHVEKK
jgi:hypothetical protein